MATHQSSVPRDMTTTEAEIFRKIEPYTMTSVDRAITLMRAVHYVVDNDLPGAFLECGVWRGGSMMAVALTLMEIGETERSIVLYDTFAGMPAPTDRDTRFDGRTAAELAAGAAEDSRMRGYASLADVTANLESTGYPMKNIHFVRGKVEDTIPQTAPEQICLLRLDTDWYESTRHELVHLYPRVVKHGVLIVDDYGHWRGAREATDEYFVQRKPTPFLHRVDYTARLVVKC